VRRILLVATSIAVTAAIAVVLVAREPPPVPVEGLPLPFESTWCGSGWSVGADFQWIRGSGFPTAEEALTATLAAGDPGHFDPDAFSKRYVRLGAGPGPGLGAEFARTRPDGDPWILVQTAWSSDGGWLVQSYSVCSGSLAPGAGGHGVPWRP
jgi:hypothetical protein